MKISVIIPVYNAERYLEECVESVIASLKGMSGEVLVINNRSSDGSPETMQRLKKKYSKIISVLQCSTPGASACRNLGAKKAKGEYIWFIDADDLISESAISELVAKAEKTGADLVMMGAERFYEDGHRDYLSAVDAKSPDCKSRFIRYGMGPWQVLIRRKWWLENRFLFREGIIHEDMELMSALILYTNKYASIDTPLYFYRQTQDSVLHRHSWSEKAYDIFPALEGLYERFRGLGAEKQYHDELEWFFIWNLLIDSAKDFAEFPEGRPGFARSREMLKQYFPTWRKNRFLKAKPIRLKLRVRLNYSK